MRMDFIFCCSGFARKAMQSNQRSVSILGARKVLFQFEKGNFNNTLQQSENLV